MRLILVALDGSTRADAVLAAAVSLAELTRAKLVLFRAIGLPTAIPANAWALSENSLEETLRHDAEGYLAELAESIPPGLFGGSSVQVGAPWQVVCAVARQLGVDLVVIGAHGYSGIDHLLGTTAAKIVNHVDRPLLVVRPVPNPAAE
jgi:universal stress protein F